MALAEVVAIGDTVSVNGTVTVDVAVAPAGVAGRVGVIEGPTRVRVGDGVAVRVAVLAG